MRYIINVLWLYVLSLLCSLISIGSLREKVVSGNVHSSFINMGRDVGRNGAVSLDVVELGVGRQGLEAVVGELCGKAEECRGVSLGDLSSCLLWFVGLLIC